MTQCAQREQIAAGKVRQGDQTTLVEATSARAGPADATAYQKKERDPVTETAPVAYREPLHDADQKEGCRSWPWLHWSWL